MTIFVTRALPAARFGAGRVIARPALAMGLNVANRVSLRTNRLRIADCLGQHLMQFSLGQCGKALSSSHYFSFDFAASRAKRSAFNRW